MASEGDRLDRLNASERELLLLLGRGHTAKSIAALKGLTELAVNERFRSARRKSGIGSSREISRLLVAQENRDDFIGLVEPAAPPPDLSRPDAPRRASSPRWRSLMAAAVLLAAAILAQQTAAPPERPVPSGAEAMFVARQPSPDLVALRASISAEPADPAWSPTAKAALSQAYHRVTDGLAVMTTLDVTCTRSLCEVLGVSRSGLTGEQITAVTGAVQNHEIEEVMGLTTLENIVQSFSTDGGGMENGSASVVFAAYWRRTD